MDKEGKVAKITVGLIEHICNYDIASEYKIVLIRYEIQKLRKSTN